MHLPHVDEPAGVAENVTRAVETGVAGLSVEDSTGRADEPLYDLDLALARVTAARQAIDRSGSDVLLTARAECFLVGHPDPLAESIRRLLAYAGAGADCLYALGLKSREQIEAVVRAVAPKPVNVLVGAPGLTVAELAKLGVRRISTGGALARAAWSGFIRAAKQSPRRVASTRSAAACPSPSSTASSGSAPERAADRSEAFVLAAATGR